MTSPGSGDHTAYRISHDPAELDLDRIHEWLSTMAYWSIGRPREVTERAIAGSQVWAAFDAAGDHVGVARLVTDGATFGWLCDVFVAADHRGRGVGTALVAAVLAHADALGLKRVILATEDAHEVYIRQGFAALAHPTMWLQRGRPVDRPAVDPAPGLT